MSRVTGRESHTPRDEETPRPAPPRDPGARKPDAPSPKQSLQDEYLKAATKEGRRVFVLLTTGREIHGVVKAHDAFTILVGARSGDLLVYKSAIGVIGPDLRPPEERTG
jgi:RNA chaperone Hfq